MREELVDKSSSPQKAAWKTIFGAGLVRSLLLWFLILAIIPLLVVSFVSYYNARQALRKNAAESLLLISHAKTEHVSFYFNRMLTDLQQEADEMANIQFLEELKRAFSESGKSIGEFVKSYKWTMIAENDEYAADIKTFQRTYGYCDVFLIDTDGNILFSIEAEDDLGTNLFNGPYSDTLFASVCEKALETGQPSFSDLEFYAPSNGEIAGFLVSVLIDEMGEKIGLIAFQISKDQIDAIMHEDTRLGKTGEIYLVGTDLKSRSSCRFSKEDTTLKKRIDTQLAQLWHKEYVATLTNNDEMQEMPGDMKETTLIYPGPHNGTSVIGIHRNINIAGVNWAIVAEIETAEAFASANQLRVIVAILLGITSLVVLLITIPVAQRIVRPILQLTAAARLVAAGDLEQEIHVKSRNEIGELAGNFGTMLTGLKESRHKNETQDWLKTGQTELNDQMRGEQEITTLCRNIITYIAHYLDAQIGAIYLAEEENHRLQLISSYAYTKRKNISNTFSFGEGLVGQAALEKESIHLVDVPDDYITVSSGLDETSPRNIIVLPFLLKDEVVGVIELGSLKVFSDLHIEFLKQVTEPAAIAVKSAQNRLKMQELLEKTQAQSEELQNQQEELKASNEELEQQTERLKSSEEQLKAQQEELETTNSQLEEKAVILEEQKQELEKSWNQVQAKSKELELTNKYKSEFLSNMSHELRTPLNSLLILSKMLMDNSEGNLTDEQVDSAKVIHEGGTELLSLINEILDLSKIEAGKMDISIEDIQMVNLVQDIEKDFNHVAEKNGIQLKTHIQEGLPEFIRTDGKRAKQILKNLLSNAFKFTKGGSVTITISRPDEKTNLSYSGLDHRKSFAFAISDTGIGVSEEKQKMIFNAFQQADGTIDRKYGGTGLGLSISKEISKLLGGEIQLVSEKGVGSTFTLYLPEVVEGPVSENIYNAIEKKDSKQEEVSETKDTNKCYQPGTEVIADDRTDIKEDDKVILIIEDDPRFAKILYDISHEKGFKCLVAGDGETGLTFAADNKPEAIILDIGLPDKDGFAVIDELKDNPTTRHIPVHFISARDEAQSKTKALSMGAIGYLTKPVSAEQLENTFNNIHEFISHDIKKLLVAEDDNNTRESIVKLIGRSPDIEITAVGTGQEAYDLLKTQKFDCMVLDLGLPDMSGFDLLSKMKEEDDISTKPPVVVYSGKDLSREEAMELREYAGSVIVKGAQSPERLLDETSLFLHRVETSLPLEQQRMIRMAHEKESILHGKNILVVDDDMRNVFALSHALKSKGMNVLRAENGKKALELLEANPDIDIVLMDIMMPEMDGYETMKRIRAQEKYWKLPILALTAKAMKGDREKCIEAGANDYLAKPIDIDKVFSMLRVWLYM